VYPPIPATAICGKAELVIFIQIAFRMAGIAYGRDDITGLVIYVFVARHIK
jgi:hypothetical protein